VDAGNIGFHTFAGLVTTGQIFNKVPGRMTAKECLAACSGNNKCNAYSYSKERQNCKTSEQGIRFDDMFVYYEQNRVIKAPIVERKMGESNVNDLSEKDKAIVQEAHKVAQKALVLDKQVKEAEAAAAKEGRVADITTSPTMIAIEQKAKAGKKEAQKATALAKEEVAMAKKSQEEAERSTEKKITAIKEADKQKLIKDEAALRAATAKKFAQEQAQEKLKFARQELFNKVQEASEAVDKAKVDGAKKVEDIKEKANEKEDKAALQQKRMADFEVKKIAVAEGLEASTAAKNRADRTKEKDEKSTTSAKAQEAMTIAAGEKALDSVANELKTKQIKLEKVKAAVTVKEAQEKEKGRAREMEVSEKKTGVLEKQAAVQTEERSDKAKIYKAEEDLIAKRKVAAFRLESVEKETEERTTKKKVKDVSAAAIEAIRARDSAVMRLKSGESTNAVEVQKVKQNANANEEKAALKNQETTNQLISIAKQVETNKQQLFEAARDRDNENYNKQVMKRKMDLVQPSINKDLAETEKLAAIAKTIKSSWQIKKDMLQAARTAAVAKLQTELTKATLDAKAETDRVKLETKEKSAKHVAEMNLYNAKMDAKGRIKLAGTKEKAAKSPGKTMTAEHKKWGMHKVRLTCDVAAYAESGPQYKGVKEWPDKHSVWVDAVVKDNQAVAAGKDADFEYHRMLKLNNETLTGAMNIKNKTVSHLKAAFDKMKDKAHKKMEEIDLKLNGIPSMDQLNRNMAAITNGQFGKLLGNSTTLLQSPPTPAPTLSRSVEYLGTTELLDEVVNDETDTSSVVNLGEDHMAEPNVEAIAEQAANGAVQAVNAVNGGAGKQVVAGVTKAGCSGNTPDGGACTLKKATCGVTGKKDGGSPPKQCKVNAAGNGCQVNSGACQFIAGSTTECSHPTCRFTPGVTPAHCKVVSGDGAYQGKACELAPATEKKCADKRSGAKCKLKNDKCHESQRSERRRNGGTPDYCTDIPAVTANSKCKHNQANKCKFVPMKTAKPTPVPTPVPTVNQKAFAQAKEQAAKLKTQSAQLKQLQTYRATQLILIDNAKIVYNMKAQAAMAKFKGVQTKNEQVKEAVKSKRAKAMFKAYQAGQELVAAKGQLDAIGTFPANKAYGAMPANKAKLVIQKDDDISTVSFMKFPASMLQFSDTVSEATLWVYKAGGSGGAVVVSAASCAWSRSTLTYTKTTNLVLEQASTGKTAYIPKDKAGWMAIKLKANVVQRARLEGPHICLEIKGGDPDAPTELASENVPKQEPYLELLIGSKSPKLQYGAQPNIFIPKNASNAAAENKKKCIKRLRREITEELTNKVFLVKKKKAVVKTANARKSVGEFANAEDVFKVITMQVDVTKDAEGKIQKVGDKLKKEIKVVVSKKLTSIANSGNATEQDMAAAAATLANKAAKQLGAEAQVEAKKIKAGVNQKLAKDQKEVQDKNKLEKQLLSDKEKQIAKSSGKLTTAEQTKLQSDAELMLAMKVPLLCTKLTAKQRLSLKEDDKTLKKKPSPEKEKEKAGVAMLKEEELMEIGEGSDAIDRLSRR